MSWDQQVLPEPHFPHVEKQNNNIHVMVYYKAFDSELPSQPQQGNKTNLVT